MQKFSILIILSLWMVLLPGCGSLKDKKKPPQEAPKTVVIGIVEMVSPEQNYVLIRCEQMPEIAAGTELTALDATGAESKLKLTPERKGRYLTADITEGHPRVTNLVLFKRTAQAPPLTPAAPPTVPTPMPAVTPVLPMPILPVTGLPETPPPSTETAPPPAALGGGQVPILELEPPVE